MTEQTDRAEWEQTGEVFIVNICWNILEGKCPKTGNFLPSLILQGSKAEKYSAETGNNQRSDWTNEKGYGMM